MKPNNNFPVSVYRNAHAKYGAAVGAKGLYCVAFFGHSRPANLGHRETCESIWRGLIRAELKLLSK